MQVSGSTGRTATLFGRSMSCQGAVDARVIVVGRELEKLALQIEAIPEQYVIQILSADRADQRYLGRVLISVTSRVRRVACQ